MQQLPPNVQVLGPLVDAQAFVAAPSNDPLTDDHAPVEWLTDRAILAYIATGGTLERAPAADRAVTVATSALAASAKQTPCALLTRLLWFQRSVLLNRSDGETA